MKIGSAYAATVVRARSTSSGAPPIMTVSVPASTLSEPPLNGASTTCPLPAAAIRWMVAGLPVVCETRSASSPRFATRPSSASATSSNCSSEYTATCTDSAPRAASAKESVTCSARPVEVLAHLGPAGVHGDVVSGREQPLRHGGADLAGADEADPHR